MGSIKTVISLVVIAALVSCEGEYIERSGDGAGISFATYLTRGTSIANAEGVADAGGFSVWAYSHTGPWNTAMDKTIIIDNTNSGYAHVTGVDGGSGITWNYGTTQAWPQNKNVSFFAYAPYGSAVWSGGVGVPEITYEVPIAVGSQKDLMIATQQIDRTSSPNPVNMVFNHALSRIKFSALKSSDWNDKEIIIESVELKNICYKGTVSLQTPISWAVDNVNKRNFTVSTGNGLLSTSLDVQATELTTSDGMLFLMPQTIPSDALMIVRYTIDGNAIMWQGSIPSSPGAWLPGKSYNYKLLIDGELVMIICADLESVTPGGDWN